MKYIYDDKKLNFVPYENKHPFLKYLGLILLSISMFFMGTMVTGPPMQAIYVNACKSSPKSMEFSEKNLKLKLEEFCIEHPEIVIRQSKLETGNFTSELFLKGNNLFGMKVAKIRPRLQKGQYVIGKEVYAKYDTWEESVIDYALWQSSQCSGKDSISYLSFLSKHYATDPNYSKKITNI